MLQSPKKARTCGLLQGSPLSPILFNHFIHSLLQTLNWNGQPPCPSALFFADDGVLIAPTVNKAKSLINTASHWADSYGMSFNIPKCGYIITNQAASQPCPYFLTLNGQFIPSVASYRHLGVLFKSTGIDFHDKGNLLSHRVERTLAAMRWFSATWAPRIRYNIFKRILLRTLEYSVHLHYANYRPNRYMQRLEIHQHFL